VRRLQRRIAGLGTVHQRAMDAMTPVTSQHPSGTGATPMVMPMAAVSYAPVQGYPWGTAAYQDLNPVYSPDGAVIAAYDSASFKGAIVIPAGRLSPAHQ
jgi:hypothetical protein